MENNQQASGKRNAGTRDGENLFTNQQPGQQPPEQNPRVNVEGDEPESHSESSFPQAENETLGTP